MNPLAAEQLARSHYQDLVQLAQADRHARALRPVRAWRRAAGQALAQAAVRIGTPRPRRPAVLREVRTLLDDGRCALC